jgi:hypothetical protein
MAVGQPQGHASGAIMKPRVGRIQSAERTVPTHSGGNFTNLLSA